jgi:hypothetical protein
LTTFVPVPSVPPNAGFPAQTYGLVLPVPAKWGFPAPTAVSDTSVPPNAGFPAQT